MTTTSTSNRALQELRELPLDAIEPNLSQPRRRFDEAALQALAGSVGERGVLQPVLVRPRPDGKYELIAGERRWRAAKLAGLQSIPTLVCSYDDPAALQAALIENMARESLTPVEEARACAMLVKELGLTLEQVGQRVGRSRVAVSNLMRLLDLSAEILELVERGELSEGHGRALLMAKDLKVRSQLARAAVKETWSVRRLEGAARGSKNPVSASPERDSGRGDSRKGRKVQTQDQDPDQRQAQDLAAIAVAKGWGDLLGVEVHVRTLHLGHVRLEVEFKSPETAIALADRLAASISR
jgi:ParB family chromosome partitioning protein